MLYRFVVWRHLAWCRVNMVALLLAQLFIADSWIMIATSQMPLAIWMVWFYNGTGPKPLLQIYLLLVAFRFIRQFFASSGDVPCDQPLLQPVARDSKLSRFLDSVSDDFSRPKYKRVAFFLSPIRWRVLGNDLSEWPSGSGVAAVPLGCLGFYSVLDLRCELAHRMVRSRSRLIVPACHANLLHLTHLAQDRALQRTDDWQVRLVRHLRMAYLKRLAAWRFLVDSKADLEVAGKYGGAAVSDWVQRSCLAQYSIAHCAAQTVGPMAEEGILVSVSETCRGYHVPLEAGWREALMAEMTRKERSPDAAIGPLLLRLAALQYVLQGAGGFDPGAASILFEDLDSIEERVVRHEISVKADGELRRLCEQDVATEIVIPRMRKQVERNSQLLAGRTLTDIPDLLRNAKHLAARYITDERFLLARVQREALIPDLLTSVLTIGLIQAGWSWSYSVANGLSLHLATRVVQPERILDDLRKGKVSDAEFCALIQS